MSVYLFFFFHFLNYLSICLFLRVQVLANEIVFPDQISTRLSSVGGLEPVQEVLRAKVLLPLQRPDLFSSPLLRLERGVLLYGRPGARPLTLTTFLSSNEFTLPKMITARNNIVDTSCQNRCFAWSGVYSCMATLVQDHSPFRRSHRS